VRPDLPNADLGIVSDDIFNLDQLPKSILIIGGGYIACEFACILNGLGVEVTQYYRGAQILRGFDDEARGLVAESMRESGINLHVGSNIVEMSLAADRKDGPQPTASDASMGASAQDAEVLRQQTGGAAAGRSGPVWVKSTNGGEKVFDMVLFATGRDPSTKDMGLEDIGVSLGRRGEIEVDDYSQTGVPSIYAIGDVTDRVNLTPVAIREGMACGHERGRSAGARRGRSLLHLVQADADGFRGQTRPGADEAGGVQGNARRSGLSHRRTKCGRADPDAMRTA